MNDSKQSTRIAALHALEEVRHSSRQSIAREPRSGRACRKAWHRSFARGLRRRGVRRTLQVAGIAFAVIVALRRRIMGAARRRSGRVRHRHAVPGLRDRTDARQQAQGRDRRHADRARRPAAARRFASATCWSATPTARSSASAPKAEVAVSATGLLTGSLHAKRVSLVGAELAVRIETDGQITISTGAERRPLAVTPAIVKPAMADASAPSQPLRQRKPPRHPTGADNFVGVDGLDRPLTPGPMRKMKFSANSA